MAKKKGLLEKKFPKSYARLAELADKSRVELKKILGIIGKEADLSSKVLKRKIEMLGLDTEIEKKYIGLGKEAYSLIKDGRINEDKLNSIAQGIDKLYRTLEEKKKEMGKLKQEMKKAAKPS